MIAISKFIDDTMRKIKKLNVNECLDLRTYKKDRSVVIEKIQERFNVYEDGFITEEYRGLSIEEVERLLKVIRKREFPRSNMFWSSIYVNKP